MIHHYYWHQYSKSYIKMTTFRLLLFCSALIRERRRLHFRVYKCSDKPNKEKEKKPIWFSGLSFCLAHTWTCLWLKVRPCQCLYVAKSLSMEDFLFWVLFIFSTYVLANVIFYVATLLFIIWKWGVFVLLLFLEWNLGVWLSNGFILYSYKFVFVVRFLLKICGVVFVILIFFFLGVKASRCMNDYIKFVWNLWWKGLCIAQIWRLEIYE